MMVWHLALKLSVTEDGLTAETGLRIEKNYCGIGTSFTLHLIMMNFHYIDEKKMISCFILDWRKFETYCTNILNWWAQKVVR